MPKELQDSLPALRRVSINRYQSLVKYGEMETWSGEFEIRAFMRFCPGVSVLWFPGVWTKERTENSDTIVVFRPRFSFVVMKRSNSTRGFFRPRASADLKSFHHSSSRSTGQGPPRNKRRCILPIFPNFQRQISMYIHVEAKVST